MSTPLSDWLQARQGTFGPLVSYDLHHPKVFVFDFTAQNADLTAVDLRDTPAFARYVDKRLREEGSRIGIGGYLEDRVLYQRSAHYDGTGTEPRRLHLGMDIWAPAYTPIFAPLAGRVHSFADNQGFGNYGPTIILEHAYDHGTFHTLYGHLSLASLEGLHVGQPVAQGERVGELGPYPENGDWPPHLHFQIIDDMGDWWGDYPGVAAGSEREHYRQNCPDPNYVFNFIPPDPA
ncbi:peptidoglycan DD-metalloendopeptidase family protein [Catalinimonas alkaloidigena]|nr:peptidoglycan DD-metalloendopeptidase family protein [Catalinimonas alkaloidigena]